MRTREEILQAIRVRIGFVDEVQDLYIRGDVCESAYKTVYNRTIGTLRALLWSLGVIEFSEELLSGDIMQKALALLDDANISSSNV